MPDPSTASYFGVPGFVLLWIVTLVSFVLFGLRMVRYVRVLARARPDPRWGDVGKRLKLVLAQVFAQRRLLNEPVIGVAHFLIFWAFVFYATGFFWTLVAALLPVLQIPYPDDVAWMALALEVLGAVALVALVVAAVRRYIVKPPRLEQSRDASVILALIALVLVTFLVGDGARAVAEGPADVGTPVSGPLGQALAAMGLTRDGAHSLYVAMWWVHLATVLGFLAYLPYSKHLHLLASPFGVWFASLESGTLAPSSGAGRLEEFTWRQLFSGLACAECGRCDRACPVFIAGFALSPKELIHHVKELVLAAARAGSGSVEHPAQAGSPENAPVARVEPPAVREALQRLMQPEPIWGCTTCGACMAQCPVFNEHIPLVVEMRRHLVFQGAVETRLQEALTNLTRYGNSFGQSPRARTKWTQGLGFPIKDARKQPVDYLWFVGDYASYHPRAQAATRAAARVFQAAGLDFGILYEAEQNAGNDVRRVGEEGLFEVLREQNLKRLDGVRCGRILTTDPHTYHVLKHEYAGAGGNGHGNGVHVVHAIELVGDLVQQGRLNVRRSLDAHLTYHDPCYLGRYNGIYAAPRRLLGALGATLTEMPRNRANAACCGAGGGRIWMEDVTKVTERPAESRVREAGTLEGVGTLTVACPKDLVMFEDALKTTGLEGRLVIKDTLELVDETVAAASTA
jgi:Fe-S oxidoreductase